MRFLLVTIFSFLFLGSVQKSFAQTDRVVKQQELSFQIGWRVQSIYDQRLSARTKSYGMPKVGFTYAKQNEQKREVLQFSYAWSLKQGESQELLNFKTIHPQINYRHERKVGEVWLGGYLDHYTLLNFAQSPTSYFNNNFISYTVSQSVGPSISWGETFADQWSFAGNAQLGLLHYLIRPAYGHPYPDNYLNEEVFHPTRAGMGKALLKSGRLKSLDKVQHFKVVFGLFYQTNSSFRAGLQYQLELFHQQGSHKSGNTTHDILLNFAWQL